MKRNLRHNGSRPRGRGYSLAECLIAILILAGATVGLLQTLWAGEMQAAHSVEEVRAVLLAESLLEEILSKPYEDPQGATGLGPDSGETGRVGFDNMDDYHGMSEQAGALTDAFGESLDANYQTFDRAVTCSNESSQSVLTFSSVNGLRVTITVTGQNGMQWTLERFIPEPRS